MNLCETRLMEPAENIIHCTSLVKGQGHGTDVLSLSYLLQGPTGLYIPDPGLP
jgi:hypothetical protein